MTVNDNEEDMLERILSYLDDETKIVQYGATYNGNICFNGLCVDDPKRIVVREGKEIELTYAVNHCISLKLPWLFLIALVAVMGGIYLIFVAYAKVELKNAEILPAIREE